MSINFPIHTIQLLTFYFHEILLSHTRIIHDSFELNYLSANLTQSHLTVFRAGPPLICFHVKYVIKPITLGGSAAHRGPRVVCHLPRRILSRCITGLLTRGIIRQPCSRHDFRWSRKQPMKTSVHPRAFRKIQKNSRGFCFRVFQRDGLLTRLRRLTKRFRLA